MNIIRIMILPINEVCFFLFRSMSISVNKFYKFLYKGVLFFCKICAFTSVALLSCIFCYFPICLSLVMEVQLISLFASIFNKIAYISSHNFPTLYFLYSQWQHLYMWQIYFILSMFIPFILFLFSLVALLEPQLEC